MRGNSTFALSRLNRSSSTGRAPKGRRGRRATHAIGRCCKAAIERLEERRLLSLASVFEIDGNALDQSSPVTSFPDDWNSALTSGVLPAFQAPPSHAIVNTGVIADKASIDTTFFTSGGSKDVNDVTQWQYSNNDVAPDKNDI